MTLKSVKKNIFWLCEWTFRISYNKTIEDPKEAIKKTPSVVLYVRKVSIPIVIIENKPANIDFFKFFINNFIFLRL